MRTPQHEGGLQRPLLVYAIGFCAFYPQAFTASDEALYVEQAVAFSHGSLALPGGVPVELPPGPMSYYPPGTSLLQTPFVFIGGWRAAAWASLFSMAATAAILARWLRDAGYSPGFALLFLAYAPTLVLGRVALSDLPSAAVVTLGLWLFWTAEGRPGKAFLAGLFAGLSLLFRETNFLVFIPFLLSATLRRDSHWTLLVAGTLTGASLRLLTFAWVFGSPTFMRDLESWALAAAVDSVPIYGFALMVLVPGGLVSIAMYRGPRRRELIAAVALFVGAYVFHDYSAQSSGGLARIAAAGRYFIPVVPLITLAWADAVSRGIRGVRSRNLVPVASASIVAAAFSVHPFIYYWNEREAAIVQDIYAHTAAGDALIADDDHNKYISPVYGQRTSIWMLATPTNELARVTKRYPSTHIILVSRTETEPMAALSIGAETSLIRRGGIVDSTWRTIDGTVPPAASACGPCVPVVPSL